MFFESWSTLGRILVVGVLAYLALVFLLRISGKRTLSKWNSFDFVVTVAFGSTLGSTLLSPDTSLTEGVFAFALLIGLQFAITALSVRSSRIQSWVKAQPTLLVYRGELRRETLQRTRVTESEVYAAVRARGLASLASVAAVVLETDGSFSVIDQLEVETATAMSNVQGFAGAAGGPRVRAVSG